MRPLLELLERLGYVNVIYRDVGTVGELEHYLQRWTQRRYETYSLAYLAFHGDEGSLEVGRESVSLAEIAEMLDGRGTARVAHFSSCSTLGVDESTAQAFLRTSGLRGVTGYAKAVDWLESAAFELLLIEALTSYTRVDHAYRRLMGQYPDLVEALGLRCVWRRRP